MTRLEELKRENIKNYWQIVKIMTGVALAGALIVAGSIVAAHLVGTEAFAWIMSIPASIGGGALSIGAYSAIYARWNIRRIEREY